MSDAVAAAAEAVDTTPGASATASAQNNAEKAKGPQGPNGPKKKKPNNQNRKGGPQDRRPAMKFKADLQGQDSRVASTLETTGKPPRQLPSEQGKSRRDPNSNRTQTLERMLNFVPQVSHPAPLLTVALTTEYTKRMYLDQYGRAQISLYNLIAYLPILMRQSRVPEDKAEAFHIALEDMLNKRIRDLAARMKGDMAKAKKVAQDNGVRPVEKYSQTQLSVSLPTYTPQIADMLGLLPLFDSFITYVDALWLGGYMNSVAREKQINGYRNEMVTMIRMFMHLYKETARLTAQGESGALADVLAQRLDPASLPDRLDDADEAEAQKITGASIGAAAA